MSFCLYVCTYFLCVPFSFLPGTPKDSEAFSLTFFFRLIPWSIEAPCVHLSAQVSKTWTRRRSASSLPRETKKAPMASVNRVNFLSRSFIGFLWKPRNISLFLSIFLSTIFSPYLSLNHPPTPFFLQVPLDPAGTGPQQSWRYDQGFRPSPGIRGSRN